MHRLLFLAVLSPVIAQAQSTADVGYQGRLMDSAGNPISAPTAITFRLFGSGADTDQAELWSVTQTLGLTDGYYSTFLPLPAKVIDGSERYLELSVGGQALKPRQKVGWAPYAMLSKNVAGETVATERLGVSGSAAVTGSGLLSVDPNNPSTLTGLNTQLTKELQPGDTLTVKDAQGQAYTYQVRIVNSDTSVVIAPGVVKSFVNSAFSIQRAVARVSQGGQPALTISGTGDVGIGTATPSTKLDVAGDSHISGQLSVGGNVNVSGTIKGLVEAPHIVKTPDKAGPGDTVYAPNWGPWTDDRYDMGASFYLASATSEVVITGLVKTPTVGTGQSTIFTLPPGYRPAIRKLFIVATSLHGSDYSFGHADVWPDGSVVLRVTGDWTGWWVNLTGIRFRAEQ